LNDASLTYTVSSIGFSYESTSGTSLSIGNDQTISGIPIGFAFTYWGTDYTTVGIADNSIVSFTGSSMIFGMNMDLYPSTGYYINYQTIGSAPNRKFVVSYHIAYIQCQTTFADSQIVLYETPNIIKINVKSHPGCNSRWSIQGIIYQGNPTYTPGRGNTDWSGTYNDAVEFDPIFTICDTCQPGYQRTTNL